MDGPDAGRVADDPTKAAAIAAYASTHTRLDGIDESAFEYFRTNFARHLPNSRRARLADLGCGRGELLRWLELQGFENLVGVELSPEQADIAERSTRAVIRRGDIESMLTDEDELDLVFAVDVLEHVPRARIVPVLTSVAASMAPGGLLVVQSVNATGPLHGSLLHGDLTHELAFTRRSLQQTGALAGLDLVACSEVRLPPGGALRTVRRLLWKVVRALYLLRWVIEVGPNFEDAVFTRDLIAVFQRPAQQ